jgi:hypothetical protein
LYFTTIDFFNSLGTYYFDVNEVLSNGVIRRGYTLKNLSGILLVKREIMYVPRLDLSHGNILVLRRDGITNPDGLIPEESNRVCYFRDRIGDNPPSYYYSHS